LETLQAADQRENEKDEEQHKLDRAGERPEHGSGHERFRSR
jgi:hypothetical protein